MPLYIRHWEFSSNNTEDSVIISESQKLDTVILQARTDDTTISVELSEVQLRAIGTLIGYSPDCVQFQAEPTNEL